MTAHPEPGEAPRVTDRHRERGASGETPSDLTDVRAVIVHLCVACIKGVGQECHTPGCALFLHRVDIPIMEELLEDAEPYFVLADAADAWRQRRLVGMARDARLEAAVDAVRRASSAGTEAEPRPSIAAALADAGSLAETARNDEREAAYRDRMIVALSQEVEDLRCESATLRAELGYCANSLKAWEPDLEKLLRGIRAVRTRAYQRLDVIRQRTALRGPAAPLVADAAPGGREAREEP